MQRRTSVEIQAYSIEEATRLALEELGLTVDEVDIEILSDAGPDDDAEALVRVTAKGMASQPIPRALQPAPPKTQPTARTNGGEQQSGREPRQRQRRDPASGRREELRGGRSGPDDRPSRRGSPPQRSESGRATSDDEAVACEVVSDLLARMGVVAEVIAVDNPSTVPHDDEEPTSIFVDIVGRDLGNLIGRRGDHLSQIQYLVNQMVSRRLGAYTRVIIDVEGYRARREESLIGLAERVARQVARTRRPMVLEPMPPNERRVIHLALRQNPDVTTQSSGEGNQRRITVEPRG